MKKSITIITKVIVAFAFWTAVWVLASAKVNNAFLFPKPQEVFSALFSLIGTADFWLKTAASLLRVIAGIIISLLLGVLLAALTSCFSPANTLLSPLMSAIKATPVASFIILALVWMRRDILPVFTAILIVLPIVWSNISAGISSVNRELREVAKVYGFGRAKTLTKLYIPSVMPFFLSSCRASLGMAWKAGIAAEVLATPKTAMGTELYFAKTYLDTPALFAWTLVIILMSVVLEKILVFLITRLSEKLYHSPEVKSNGNA